MNGKIYNYVLFDIIVNSFLFFYWKGLKSGIFPLSVQIYQPLTMITQGISIVTLYKYLSILAITGLVITHILRPRMSRRTHTGNLLCACFLFWIYICLWQLINLEVSNFEYQIFVVVFCRQAQWKKSKQIFKCENSKFDASKSMSCRGHIWGEEVHILSYQSTTLFPVSALE